MIITSRRRYLPPEMQKHVERFTGCPYDPEGDARIRAFVVWKRLNHRLMEIDRKRREQQSRDRKVPLKRVK
jgi:hypothetical protein